jgi:hypothetical protein
MTSSWLETIAQRIDMTPTQAEIALRKRGITADRPLRPARTLTIKSIAFKGEKRGSGHGVIDFEWSDLKPGIWAVTSEKNLAGKSSVLEIILWCLRGVPKDLQGDVRKWLNWVAMTFLVDEQDYRIEFRVEAGVPIGSLSRLRPGDGIADALDKFSTDGGFAAAMSRFMMNTLDLDPIPSMQGKDGDKQAIEHGWTALSGGLYFGGDHKQLLGDVQMSGLPARMLQMYIGLPWALTVMQANTVKKEVDQEQEQNGRAAARAAVESTKARSRILVDLAAAQKALESLSSEQVTPEDIERLAAEVSRLSPIAIEQATRHSDAETELKTLRGVANDDERALRDVRENIVAHQFFNGLEPVCCPRCEAKVTSERIKKESADLSCSLCSENIPVDMMEGASETIEATQRRAEASRAAVERAVANERSLRMISAAASKDFEAARKALENAAKGTTFQQRRDAELAVARLEGALEERQTEPGLSAPSSDVALVEAAAAEAKKAYEENRGDIMLRLSKEILSLGQRLGVKMLESVNLSSNATLALTKGGEDTSFGKVTAGERLRLRIATAIALLRVGKERGLGRHPGLLIIDSPGAEEVSEIDLAALLGELQKITNETPGLQILVASANPAAIVGQLGAERCRVAEKDSYLW